MGVSRSRLVTCGATTGFDAKVDLRFVFNRQLSLLGSFMGPWVNCTGYCSSSSGAS